MPIRLMTYRKGSTLPALPGSSLPHATELFRIYEQTPGYDPILIAAYQQERPVAKLLAVVRRSVRMFPPSFIKRCEVFGTGEYFDDSINREDLFGTMLNHLTDEVKEQCFLIEFRNLNMPLFGYKHFRANGYFSINWLRVYNSLHSKSPMERLSPSRKRQINKAIQSGVSTCEATTEEEFDIFLHILKRHYASKIRKHFPDLHLFHLLTRQPSDKEMAKVFLVKYKGKIIGGSFCMFSANNAYLCFSGGLYKTYARLYPGVMAVWEALTYAYKNGCQHFEFVDAGLPFKKTGYHDFILQFGGKQVGTRRWFRFRWKWLNTLLCKMYR